MYRKKGLLLLIGLLYSFVGVFAIKRDKEKVLVDECAKNNDIELLIKTYRTSVNYKDYAFHCLFNKVDYKKIDYEAIVSYRDAVKEEELRRGFDGMIEQYEEWMIGRLSECELDDAISYYFKHENYPFAARVVESRLVSEIANDEQYEKYRLKIGEERLDSVMGRVRNLMVLNEISNMSLDTLAAYYAEQDSPEMVRTYIDALIDSVAINGDYDDIKQCDAIFSETEFSEKVHSIRAKKREEFEDTIQAQLDAYLAEELNMVEHYLYSAKYEALESVVGLHYQLIEHISKEKLPEKQDLVRKRVSDAVATVYKNYKKENDIINKSVRDYYRQINNARFLLVASLLNDTTKEAECGIVDTTDIRYYKISPNYKYEDIYAISEIQNKTDWVGLAIKGASLAAGICSGGLLVGVLTTAADLAYDMYKENETDDEMTKYYKRFLNDFQKSLNNGISKSAESQASDLRLRIIKSQEEFKRQCYELY